MDIFQQNPFEILLIIRKILDFLLDEDDGELLKVRQLNSLWREETDPMIRYKFSLKKTQRNLNFDKKKQMEEFAAVFRNSRPLHECFNFKFNEPLEFEEDSLAVLGPNTKALCLGTQVLNVVTNGQDLFKMMDEFVENFFSPMKPNTLEKILLGHFPYLVLLQLNEMIYEEAQHAEIFKTEEERKLDYNCHVLVSLKELVLKDYWGVEDGVECKFLSDEILKISPNLKSIDHWLNSYVENSGKVVQRILAAISKFAPTVKSIVLSSNAEMLFTSTPQYAREDFENLRIESLCFSEENEMMQPEARAQRSEFLSEFVPTDQIDSFSFYQHDKNGLNALAQIGNLEQLVDFVPSALARISTLVYVLSLHGGMPFEVLNTFSGIFPLIQDFTSSMVTIPSFVRIQPWENLKTLTFQNIAFKWRCDVLLGFREFHRFVQTFAPNLTSLAIQVEDQSLEHLENLAIAYPFLVWMGNKLEVPDFSISVNEKLSWTKGKKERNLGLDSLDQLNDKFGDFTTKEITKFNFTFLFPKANFVLKRIDNLVYGCEEGQDELESQDGEEIGDEKSDGKAENGGKVENTEKDESEVEAQAIGEDGNMENEAEILSDYSEDEEMDDWDAMEFCNEDFMQDPTFEPYETDEESDDEEDDKELEEEAEELIHELTHNVLHRSHEEAWKFIDFLRTAFPKHEILKKYLEKPLRSQFEEKRAYGLGTYNPIFLFFNMFSEEMIS